MKILTEMRIKYIFESHKEYYEIFRVRGKIYSHLINETINILMKLLPTTVYIKIE